MKEKGCDGEINIRKEIRQRKWDDAVILKEEIGGMKMD